MDTADVLLSMSVYIVPCLERSSSVLWVKHLPHLVWVTLYQKQNKWRMENYMHPSCCFKVVKSPAKVLDQHRLSWSRWTDTDWGPGGHPAYVIKHETMFWLLLLRWFWYYQFSLYKWNKNNLASCKWSSEGTSLLQMIIWSGRPLANDHPKGPASYECSSGRASLLQMIESPLQIIIQRGRPLVNDLSDGPTSCK